MPINTNTGNWIQSEIDLGYGLLQRSVLEVTEQILRFTSSPGIDGTWISIHGKGIEHYQQFNEAISSFDLSSFDLISGEVYEFCIDYELNVSSAQNVIGDFQSLNGGGVLVSRNILYFTTTPIPEPSSFTAIFGIMVLSYSGFRRKSKYA